MKVAVTGLRGMPNIMGGIESHCEELYPRMLKWDPALSVECFGRRPYMKSGKAFEYEGVRVTPLPSIRLVSVEAIYSTFLAVLYAGCVKRPDVLHIHGIGPALMTPLARLLGLKVVVTHHGRDYRRAKWGPFARTLLKVGEQLALRFANAVIAVSQTLAAELCAEKPEVVGKVVFIPNGVSTLPPSAEGADDPLATWRLEPGRYILTSSW
jgi:glycosyltransferase involved in cell wall biosynthesis